MLFFLLFYFIFNIIFTFYLLIFVYILSAEPVQTDSTRFSLNPVFCCPDTSISEMAIRKKKRSLPHVYHTCDTRTVVRWIYHTTTHTTRHLWGEQQNSVASNTYPGDPRTVEDSQFQDIWKVLTRTEHRYSISFSESRKRELNIRLMNDGGLVYYESIKRELKIRFI